MSKLSDRFKNMSYDESQTEVLRENDELKNDLLEKVNSVPYWNEYSPEKQRDMVRNFVEKTDIEDKEPMCETLVPYVTKFGPLQNLLDNENVSAVFVNDVHSVHIEIDGRVFNTEMKLSQCMLQYVLNITGNRSENVYTCRIEDYIIDVIKPDVCLNGINIAIRKFKNSAVDLPAELFAFLAEKIAEKKRIVISGDVNSGKSTLLNMLLTTCLSDKRCYLFKNADFYGVKSDLLVAFDVSKCDYETLLAFAQKANPEYIVSDLNSVDDMALISTVRAKTADGAFRSLVAGYGEMAEKYAKLKVLNDFDYIVHLDKFEVASVVELQPAKTMALSVKIIFER